MTPPNSPCEFHKPRVHVEVRKQARMDKDEFSIVEDYLGVGINIQRAFRREIRPI